MNNNHRQPPIRAIKAPGYIYHSATPEGQRTLWCVCGTEYGYLHTTSGEIRTWKYKSSAARHAKGML